jgi:hypothetical protein
MRSVRRPWPIVLTFAVPLWIACAPAPPASAANPASTHSASDVISEQDLADPVLAGSTVLDAIRRLRPRFLNDRSGGISGRDGGPRVSMNGSAGFIAASELARLSVSEVSEIRYLSAADANQRFGLQGTLSPILLVTLKRP